MMDAKMRSKVRIVTEIRGKKSGIFSIVLSEFDRALKALRESFRRSELYVKNKFSVKILKVC